jgi:crossover junction endodeoxyribonuclease RuvC
VIVLGIDPGVTVTGYGVVAAGESPAALIECGVIRPQPRSPLAERLLEIYRGVTAVIDRVRPDVVSVEGVFYGQNVHTTVILGHARGAALLAAAARSVPVVEYPPAEVKNLIVGTGVASKEQVAFMVQKHLSLGDAPEPEDAADGVAVALCHVFHDTANRRTGGVGRKHA